MQRLKSITTAQDKKASILLQLTISRIILTLKAPRKNASEKCRLLKSSAANNYLTLLTNSSKEANKVDPDQTAPIGAF